MSATGKVIVAFLSGIAIGAIASAAIFAPTKAKLDMVVYSAVRLGWLCHDNDIDFDRCALVASGNAGNPP
jgi:hypothetical protein